MKLTPLLGVEFTFTTTLPVVAPVGTGTTILLALQLVGIAVTPLKVTELPPWLDPKFEPLIVTTAPTRPDVGDRLIMLGTSTVKLTPLLGVEFTVTTTLPVVAPVGTGTTILLALQLVGIAVTPLKVTELPPWLDPKFDPLIVTTVPTRPAVGERVVILGDDRCPGQLLTRLLTLRLPIPLAKSQPVVVP